MVLHAAVSKGNSPVSWNQVNGGRPVLNSTLGTKGVRDPFIIRDPNGSKFYLIATDLRMYGSGMTWDQAGRKGSLSLSIWDSTDLKTWSAQRLVQVSPTTVSISVLCGILLPDILVGWNELGTGSHLGCFSWKVRCILGKQHFCSNRHQSYWNNLLSHIVCDYI